MLAFLAAACFVASAPGMIDVTEAIGLGPTVVPETVGRLCFADINGDGWPDLIVDRHRVFINTPDAKSPIGRRFVEIPTDKTGLPTPLTGTVAVFADLDDDGKLDAIYAENAQPDDPKWKDHGRRTRWQKGNGDGTFQAAQPLPTPPRPTISIAVGDVNRDGKLDLFFANSYKAGDTYEGFPCDLLLSDGKGSWKHVSLPDEKIKFDETTDPGGRPTYGGMILSLNGRAPVILSLSYGRRWNRLWVPGPHDTWTDVAPQLGLDGDDNRSGVYPAWLVEYAKKHPQFPSAPEKPFRANGNNFDASIADVNNDGQFDLFISDITHAWAGDSSDRSRLLFQHDGKFKPDPLYNVDRVPDPKDEHWNQGDLFSELVDLNGDGLLDLVLSSGDYPDNHLRIYLQKPGGGFVEATGQLGVIHDGSQQISIADIDGDGVPDLAVSETFFRLDAKQINGRKPHLRVFVNRLAGGNNVFVLRVHGDGKSVSRDALGAIAKIELADGRKLQRQLVGIGGHGGKQHDFPMFFGLGKTTLLRRVEVIWPNKRRRSQVFRDVVAGQYTLEYGAKLTRR